LAGVSRRTFSPWRIIDLPLPVGKTVKEAVRGASDWARWWTVTLEVFNDLGGGDESDRREVQLMSQALADPTMWFLRELLHACWGRRPA